MRIGKVGLVIVYVVMGAKDEIFKRRGANRDI
jgi:hypothetical protein